MIYHWEILLQTYDFNTLYFCSNHRLHWSSLRHLMFRWDYGMKIMLRSRLLRPFSFQSSEGPGSFHGIDVLSSRDTILTLKKACSNLQQNMLWTICFPADFMQKCIAFLWSMNCVTQKLGSFWCHLSFP